MRYIWIGCRRCLRAIRGVPENDDWLISEIHSKAMLVWVWGCTWRRQWSVFDDTLGGCDRVNLEMHYEIAIKRVWRCTWSPWWSNYRDGLGGHLRASLEIHLEAVVGRVWRCTWRQWSCKLGGRNCASLEIHLEALIVPVRRPQLCDFGDALRVRDCANLEAVIWRVWIGTLRQSMDSVPGAGTLFITQLTHNRGDATWWVHLWGLMESWLMLVDPVGRHTGSWIYIWGSTHNH